MNKYFKSILSFVLCVSLCMGFAVPAMAANESNQEGITFSAALDNATLYVSDQDQVVTMTVNASAGMTMEAMGAKVVWNDALKLTGIDNSDSRIDFTGCYNLATGDILYDGTANMDQLSGVTNLAVIQFTVPANTPAGTYEVGIQNIVLSKNYGERWEKDATASATLTIQPAPTGEGYTAGVNTLTTDVTVGGTVTVNVAVNHSSDAQFAAGEMVVNYDSSKLTYTRSSLDAAKVDSSVAGTLKIADYGENKNVGNAVYTLNFTAKADGQASVTLASAAFSDKESAVGTDLVAATLSPATVTVTVSKSVHSVELPDHFTGPETVVDGEDYTFTLDENYTCDEVTATVNGETVEVIKNNDGSYTVKGVNGDLVITGTAKPQTYKVTITGETKGNPAQTATYGVDYQFTLADDVAPSTTAGTTYSLTSVKIGGVEYKGYSSEGRTYTISGEAITGNIEIVITATPVTASQYTVSKTGTGEGDAVLSATVVDKNGTATLTLTPEAGYTYTVTAKMGGNDATVNQSGNTYTVSNVTGNVVFTVTKTLVTTGVSVSKYVTLNQNNMWLVKFDTTLAVGKVPTYDGQPMFWSEEYDAYCYLVIASDLQDNDAKAKVAVADGTAVEVDYGMDVNKTGKVDANDAQLAYDIYKALYSDFDTVSMEKFLRADVNHDGKVDANDAVAVISKILNP